MKRTSHQLGICAAAAGLAFLPTAGQAADWYLNGGVVFRGCMDLNITGSSYAETLGASGIGPLNAYADRTYDDGYVRKDSSQGGGIAPNTTWNWGYDNPGQHNAGAGTLSFQRNGVPYYSSLTGGGPGGGDNMLGTGLRLQAGLPLKTGTTWSFDFVFGFQGVWGANGKFRENAGLGNVTDTYNVAGIAPFPGAGHRGAYDGPFSATATPPYTVIPNLPSRSIAPVSGPSAANGSICFDVDQNLYQLSLGPQLGFKAGSRLQFVASPTMSLNILDVNARRSETFTFGGASQHWFDKSGQREIFLGFGLTGGANLDLGKGWSTGAFGGYEWVLEEVDFKVGPNTVTVDPSGWVAGLQFGKNF